MKTSARIRFGALTAAAAVVAGGFLATAPAHAATGTITVANLDYTEGDWGSGISTAGNGFTPDAVVTISVKNDGTTIESKDVTADSLGAFTDDAWIPTAALPLPATGTDITVSATSDLGDDSNTVVLNVTAAPTPPAPTAPTLTAATSTITTADLINPEVGVQLLATGFAPNEKVTATVVYSGQTHTFEETADANGEVELAYYLEAGTAVAGTMTVTVTGENNNTATTTIQVTGDDITIGGNTDETPSLGGAPSTETAGAGAQRLPVVAG